MRQHGDDEGSMMVITCQMTVFIPHHEFTLWAQWELNGHRGSAEPRPGGGSPSSGTVGNLAAHVSSL
jgi:hypothetical protein